MSEGDTKAWVNLARAANRRWYGSVAASSHVVQSKTGEVEINGKLGNNVLKALEAQYLATEKSFIENE